MGFVGLRERNGGRRIEMIDSKYTNEELARYGIKRIGYRNVRMGCQDGESVVDQLKQLAKDHNIKLKKLYVYVDRDNDIMISFDGYKSDYMLDHEMKEAKEEEEKEKAQLRHLLRKHPEFRE